MPSQAFKIQKLVGREFEQAMLPVLSEMGFRIIDTDSWSYRLKKGVDVIVEIKGERCGIEFKLDKMSEKTHQVAIDLDSLNKTTAGIWMYGFPRGNEVDVYSMKTTELGPFAFKWPIKKNVGEWSMPVALVPKSVFIGQSFVHFFKTLSINGN
jgi:hypothetical protein